MTKKTNSSAQTDADSSSDCADTRIPRSIRFSDSEWEKIETAALVQLIEATYRGVYLLATLKRDQLGREGRGHEVDKVLRDARESLSQLNSRAQTARPCPAQRRSE